MVLTNCQNCKYLDRSPHHSGDILCGVAPAYATMWQRLSSLDSTTLDAIPVDLCRDFQLNPDLAEKEITLDLTFSSWQNLARIPSVSNVINALYNLTFSHTLNFTLEQWQSIANSCHDFQVLGQLHQHGIIQHNLTEDWISVDSSCIEAIAFDILDFELKIRFNSGCIYLYSGVDFDIFNLLRNADSKGRFFHQHIKDRYSYVRL